MRYVFCLLLAACGSTPPPPPPEDAAPASEAPASVAPELPKGARATVRFLLPGDPVLGAGLGARAGDLWLENPKVIALVAGIDHRLGPSASGGAGAAGGRHRPRPRARPG